MNPLDTCLVLLGEASNVLQALDVPEAPEIVAIEAAIDTAMGMALRLLDRDERLEAQS